MAGTTPIYGLPYPQSSDLVSAYPALGQDLATDLDGILAAKANLASPTFTGTPAAPTAANGTNTTQLATTQFVTTAVANGAGLTTVTPTSIANSGGSATVSGGAVTFSGVTSISLNGIFSSTYENYVLMMYLSTSATPYMQYRLRASGTDATTNYNRQSLYAIGTTVGGGANTGIDAWIADGNGFNGDALFQITLMRPNLAAATLFHANNYGVSQTIGVTGGRHTTASAYDGFTIFPSGGNITGVVRAYGYRN